MVSPSLCHSRRQYLKRKTAVFLKDAQYHSRFSVSNFDFRGRLFQARQSLFETVDSLKIENKLIYLLSNQTKVHSFTGRIKVLFGGGLSTV